MQTNHITNQAKNTLFIFFFAALFLQTLGCTTLGKNPGKQALREKLINTQVEIAKVQIDRGNPERALESLRKILRKYPKNTEALTMYGLAHLALSNPSTGTSYLYQAYKIQPTLAFGLNLSSGYIASNQIFKAQSLLHKLLKKSDHYQRKERLLHNLGITYSRQNKTKIAEKYFKKALEFNPSFYMSLLEMGKLEKKRHNIPQSIKYLVRSTRSCTNCYDNVHMLATEYLSINQATKARILLKKFLKNERASPENKGQAANLLNIVNRYAAHNKTRQRRVPVARRHNSQTKKMKR
jgi:Tfp pilus assembly protein PilF